MTIQLRSTGQSNLFEHSIRPYDLAFSSSSFVYTLTLPLDQLDFDRQQDNMAPARRSNLNIAFIYDSKTDYLAAGYPAIDCADLTDYVTINGVSSALTSLGHNVIHVPGIKPLVQHLAVGKQKNWDLAFNYGEGVHGSARESQVPALLEAYQVPFTFSDPATLAVCIDKAKTKVGESTLQLSR